MKCHSWLPDKVERKSLWWVLLKFRDGKDAGLIFWQGTEFSLLTRRLPVLKVFLLYRRVKEPLSRSHSLLGDLTLSVIPSVILRGHTQCYSGQGLPLALYTEITPVRRRGTVWDAKT